MSRILLEKQGEAWRSRVEGHFILGVHPIETLRKGLPEAMAQAVVDHCAMTGEDVAAFAHRVMAEIDALMPVGPTERAVRKAEAASHVLTIGEIEKACANADRLVALSSQLTQTLDADRPLPAEPRRARVPRKAAVVAPEAEQAPAEPAAAPMPVVEPPPALRAAWTERSS